MKRLFIQFVIVTVVGAAMQFATLLARVKVEVSEPPRPHGSIMKSLAASDAVLKYPIREVLWIKWSRKSYGPLAAVALNASVWSLAVLVVTVMSRRIRGREPSRGIKYHVGGE